MWKEEARKNLKIFIKAGLPYTIAGVLIIFAGMFIVQKVFAESEYLTTLLFVWIGLFWLVYQPLFRKRIRKMSQ